MILSYVQVLGMSNLSFNTSTLVSTYRRFHNLIIISFCLLFTSSFIGELDSAHRPYLISVRPCVLLTGRGRRKSHTWYQHSPVTRCVPLARIQNFATDLARPPAHCQIPALHIHHEHGLNPGHCGHHQLELQVKCFPTINTFALCSRNFQNVKIRAAGFGNFTICLSSDFM